MGHTFKGLADIAKYVDIMARDYVISGIDVSRREPAVRLDGIHVAEIWEPYPCFDAEDRMYENRTYRNYFFSAEPFDRNRLVQIFQRCRQMANFRLVNGFMPAEFAPAVYYDGDSDTFEVVLAKE